LTARSGFQTSAYARDVLDPQTRDQVLERLGFSDVPAADAEGLHEIYAAWCARVPFDNLVKRIHLVSGDPAPIPNGPPGAFFDSYLRYCTGGTCWPSSGGLHALLVSVGFDARRGSGAMRDDISGPVHSHGTVLVRIDAHDFWVDSSMLTRVPLPLRPGADTQIPRTFEAVRAEPVDRYWRVWWDHPFLPEPLGCLLLDDDVSEAHYLARYEASREVSPFNTVVYTTRVTPEGKVTVAFGQRFEKTAAGTTTVPLDPETRTKVLVEEFGYSEEIVTALPPDDPPPVPSKS
jgi:N-hydroxyarylamine O-acetyltransferase